MDCCWFSHRSIDGIQKQNRVRRREKWQWVYKCMTHIKTQEPLNLLNPIDMIDCAFFSFHWPAPSTQEKFSRETQPRVCVQTKANLRWKMAWRWFDNVSDMRFPYFETECMRSVIARSRKGIFHNYCDKRFSELLIDLLILNSYRSISQELSATLGPPSSFTTHDQTAYYSFIRINA